MPNPATATSNEPTPSAPEEPTAATTDQLTPTTHRTPSRRPPANRLQRVRSTRPHGITRRRPRAQLGAITAEYAIIIVGACAIGGVLVALLRSPAMQNALKAIINYGLKLAGVEGVHL